MHLERLSLSLLCLVTQPHTTIAAGRTCPDQQTLAVASGLATVRAGLVSHLSLDGPTLVVREERHETVKLPHIERVRERVRDECERAIGEGLFLRVRELRDHDYRDRAMKGTHLFQEQDGGLAAHTPCRKAQTGPRPPRGIETENENQVKRPTPEHHQSIVAIVNCLDLVITAVKVPEEFTRYGVAIDEQDSRDAGDSSIPASVRNRVGSHGPRYANVRNQQHSHRRYPCES